MNSKDEAILKEAKDSLVGVTPGKWFTEESEGWWELYAENLYEISPGKMVEVHPLKLAKCAKKNQNFAEYWPKPEDARFIVAAHKLVPELLDSLKASLERERKACGLLQRTRKVVRLNGTPELYADMLEFLETKDAKVSE